MVERTDTERLDWLDDEVQYHPGKGPQSHGFDLHFSWDDEGNVNIRSLREAIDAAMSRDGGASS